MARKLDPALKAELSAPVIEPVLMVMLTFRSMTCYLCSAGYDVTWNGQVFTGLGTLGGISAVSERSEVKSEGITLTLSGIDPLIMQECLEDIQALAPAKCWFGLLKQGQMVGTPYNFFAGVVDKPTISISRASATITLTLSDRMVLLNRASMRRYTAADQHAFGYPDDTAFNNVEKLNDITIRVGA